MISVLRLVWTQVVFMLLTAFLAVAEETVISLGYFPTITHAQALIAQNMSATGEGWFERYLPPGTRLVWHRFNAGPAAVEVMGRQGLDVSYIGPSPAITAFVQTQGQVVVLSGAVRGGAALVVPWDSTCSEPADFRGRRLALTQLGNTQDVVCRYWLMRGGLKMSPGGGEVEIISVPGHTLVAMLKSQAVDGIWAVEPWVSRLETEAGGRLAYVEPPATSITALLLAREDFCRDRPHLAAGLNAAHRDLTAWIVQNPRAAQKRVADELSRQTRRDFPLEAVERAWPRLVFDAHLKTEDLLPYLEAAQALGYLESGHNLDGLIQAGP